MALKVHSYERSMISKHQQNLPQKMKGLIWLLRFTLCTFLYAEVQIQDGIRLYVHPGMQEFHIVVRLTNFTSLHQRVILF